MAEFKILDFLAGNLDALLTLIAEMGQTRAIDDVSELDTFFNKEGSKIVNLYNFAASIEYDQQLQLFINDADLGEADK